MAAWKWLLSLCLLSCSGLTFAQDEALKAGDVLLPREFRVRNSASNCVWCAAEMCFFGAAGHEEFEGIKARAVREGWRGAGMHNVLRAAKDAGIETASTSNADYQVLYDAVANGTGAYIEIPGHAIWLCGIDEDGVRVVDNNGSLNVQAWSAAKFRRTWEGIACFPLLNRRRKPKPPPEPTPSQPAPAPEPGPAPVPQTPGTPPAVGPAGPPGPPGKDGKDAQINYEKLAAIVAAQLAKQPQPTTTRTRIVPAKPQ